MIRRLLFLSTFLCVFALFLAKDMILGRIVSRYVEKTFSVECTIKKISLGPKGVNIRGVHLRHPEAEFTMEEGILNVRWQDILHPVVTRAAISRAALRLTEIPSGESPQNPNASAGQRGIALGFPKEANSYVKFPLPLMLSEATFAKDGSPSTQMEVVFSFEGAVSPSGIEEIDYFELIRGDIRTDTMEIEGATLNKSFDDRREFYISALTIKDDTFHDIRFPFIIQQSQIVFAQEPYEFLGRQASLSGVVDFSDYKNFCLVLRCDGVSAEEVIKLLGNESGFLLRGNFQGKIRLCLSDGRLNQLEGRLENVRGGFIHIKKEVPVPWLKEKFTEDSYKALLENFKNYAYNTGEFIISQDADKVSISVHFDSKENGKRNLTINLYDFL